MRKVILAVVVVMLSGCAEAGIQGKLGFYRADERQESQRTYNKPLKCLFVPCDDGVAGGQGS